jgi:hypothetical protein
MMQKNQFNEKEFNALVERLDSLNQTLSARTNPEAVFYDNADAIQLLKVSRRTLQSWRDGGLISFSQVGSKIYYSLRDIQEFMQKNSKPSFS